MKADLNHGMTREVCVEEQDPAQLGFDSIIPCVD
jgi:hypothetical protein